jgi:hypothetical protein
MLKKPTWDYKVTEKDFLTVANALTKLAILKNVKMEEQAIAIQAKFLLTELSAQDILRCCGYFAKRQSTYPESSQFFNLICPAKTLDEVAEEEIGGLMDMIRNGAYIKEHFTENQKHLLDKWSWSSLCQMRQIDLDKTRTSMLFFLKGKLSTDGKTKEILSKQAFDDYHKLLTTRTLQGEAQNAIEESFK